MDNTTTTTSTLTPAQQNYSGNYTNGVKNPVKLVQGMSENKHGIINKVTDLNVSQTSPPTVVIYGGYVNSDGTASSLPSGWTTSVGTGGSVGRYTITHNLGTTNYVIIPTAVSLGVDVSMTAQIFDFQTNSCIVAWLDAGSSQADTAFQFILLVTDN